MSRDRLNQGSFLLPVRECEGQLCVSTFWPSFFLSVGVLAFAAGVMSVLGAGTRPEAGGVYQVPIRGEGYANWVLFVPGVVCLIGLFPLFLLISGELTRRLRSKFGLSPKELKVFSWCRVKGTGEER